MTPDRRLDQIEPLLSESLQKTDRLIEGQGKLLDLTTATSAQVEELKAKAERTDDKIEQVRATGEITANGLAKLTVTVNELRNEMRAGFQRSEATQQEILALLRQRLS